MKKVEKLSQQSGSKLNCFQAMNYFKLIGRDRRITGNKFLRDEHTVEEWDSILKENKLLR